MNSEIVDSTDTKKTLNSERDASSSSDLMPLSSLNYYNKVTNYAIIGTVVVLIGAVALFAFVGKNGTKTNDQIAVLTSSPVASASPTSVVAVVSEEPRGSASPSPTQRAVVMPTSTFKQTPSTQPSPSAIPEAWGANYNIEHKYSFQYPSHLLVTSDTHTLNLCGSPSRKVQEYSLSSSIQSAFGGDYVVLVGDLGPIPFLDFTEWTQYYCIVPPNTRESIVKTTVGGEETIKEQDGDINTSNRYYVINRKRNVYAMEIHYKASSANVSLSGDSLNRLTEKLLSSFKFTD